MPNDELPDSVRERLGLTKTDSTERQEAIDREQERVRIAIRLHLYELGEALGKFEQTTHPHICVDGIKGIGRDLAKCYENPTGLYISNLNQAIRKFLNEVV